MMSDDTRDELVRIAAAFRCGLVECPHCHRMVDPDSLGWTCTLCGSDGCCECIGTNGQGRDVCLDPFDCPAAFEREE